MAEPLIQDVSDTAFMVAAFRAMESRRPDALFRDPLAERLAGERGAAMGAAMGQRFLRGWMMVVRTVVIDELIQAAIGRGVDTVLNLGAGLDTRPYRMELPAAVRWIEVDMPRVVAWKEERLAGETPRCRLERRTLDLTDGPARRAFLADACAGAQGVLVLTEGVIPYLAAEDVASLAEDLRAREEVRGWIVDYFSSATYRYRRRRAFTRHMRNAPFRFQPADWHGFFRQHGWEVGEMRYIAAEGRRLGRPAPLPRLLRLWVRIAYALASPARREAFGKFAGYALLEPSGGGGS